ncbi:hypothetical protein LSTR_LSTR015125, partial [Laodelphax striatellus]
MAVRLIADFAESVVHFGAMRHSSLLARVRFIVECKTSAMNRNIKIRVSLKDSYSQLREFIPYERPSAISRTNTVLNSFRNVCAIQNSCYSTSTLRTLSVGFESVSFEEKRLPRFYSSSSNNDQNTGPTKDLIDKNLGVKKKQFVDNVLRNNQKKMRLTKIKLQKSGKIILKDIKESKSKMKEKMEEIIERENIWTIPNMLTVLRIAMSPFLGYLICQNNYELALGLVIFAGFTDF